MIFIILLFIKIVSFPLFVLIWFDFYLYLSIHLCFHYKKNGLLRRSKTAAKAQKSAAKGPFNL